MGEILKCKLLNGIPWISVSIFDNFYETVLPEDLEDRKTFLKSFADDYNLDNCFLTVEEQFEQGCHDYLTLEAFLIFMFSNITDEQVPENFISVYKAILKHVCGVYITATKFDKQNTDIRQQITEWSDVEIPLCSNAFCTGPETGKSIPKVLENSNTNRSKESVVTDLNSVEGLTYSAQNNDKSDVNTDVKANVGNMSTYTAVSSDVQLSPTATFLPENIDPSHTCTTKNKANADTMESDNHTAFKEANALPSDVKGQQNEAEKGQSVAADLSDLNAFVALVAMQNTMKSIDSETQSDVGKQEQDSEVLGNVTVVHENGIISQCNITAEGILEGPITAKAGLVNHTDLVQQAVTQSKVLPMEMSPDSDQIQVQQNQYVVQHVMYHCDECQSVFLTDEDLRNHRQKEACCRKDNIQAGKSGSRKKSKKKTKSEIKLKDLDSEDLETQECDKPYKCYQCSKKFKIKANYKRHTAGNCQEKKFICSICGAGFISKSRLHKHEMVHTGVRPYACSQCKLSFITSGHLREHKIHKHTTEKPFKCTQCPKAFKFARELRYHQAKHKDSSEEVMTKIHICQYCGKGFSNKIVLEQHEGVHRGENSYYCGVCERNYSCEKALKEHLKSHVPENACVCNECGKQFSTARLLKCHNQRVHQKMINVFICEYCSHVFTEKGKLKRHVNTIHVSPSEKSYIECQICNKKVQAANINQHLIRHSGNPQYGCSYCEKHFYTNSDKIKHERVHTGERPYICEICCKSFNHSSTLAKHKKTHLKAVAEALLS